MNNLIIFFISSLFLLFSCESSQKTRLILDSESQLVSWYKENKKLLVREKQLNFINIKGQFIPNQIVELREKGEINLVFEKEYSRFEYYQVEFSLPESNVNFLKSGISNLGYQELVDYLSYKIVNDFTLNINDSVVACKNVVFERSFGIKPSVTLNLVFDSIEKFGTRQLVYKDRIFNEGIIKLKIVDSKVLREIPKYVSKDENIWKKGS